MAKTTRLAYKGYADTRTLTAADMKRLGHEGDFSKTSFTNGEAVEVDSAVAKVLMEHDLTRNDFAEVQASEVDQPAATDKTTTTESPAKK